MQISFVMWSQDWELSHVTFGLGIHCACRNPDKRLFLSGLSPFQRRSSEINRGKGWSLMTGGRKTAENRDSVAETGVSVTQTDSLNPRSLPRSGFWISTNDHPYRWDDFINICYQSGNRGDKGGKDSDWWFVDRQQIFVRGFFLGWKERTNIHQQATSVCSCLIGKHVDKTYGEYSTLQHHNVYWTQVSCCHDVPSNAPNRMVRMHMGFFCWR